MGKVPLVSEFEILSLLNSQRYMTLRQIRRALNEPIGARAYQGAAYQLLNDMKRGGLVESEQVEGRGVHVWYCSEAGLATIPAERRREYVPSGRNAGGMDHKHSWGVVEVGLAYLAAARSREDDFELTWLEREVKMRDARSAGGLVIADGILQYREVGAPGHVLTAILELDRTTSPGRIVRKLRAYSEIRSSRRLWPRLIPGGGDVPILYVVSGEASTGARCGEKNWAGDKRRSLDRAERLASYVAAVGDKAVLGLPVFFASLPALIASGPFAPVWTRVGGGEKLDWQGRPVMMVHKGGMA